MNYIYINYNGLKNRPRLKHKATILRTVCLFGAACLLVINQATQRPHFPFLPRFGLLLEITRCVFIRSFIV